MKIQSMFHMENNYQNCHILMDQLLNFRSSITPNIFEKPMKITVENELYVSPDGMCATNAI